MKNAVIILFVLISVNLLSQTEDSGIRSFFKSVAYIYDKKPPPQPADYGTSFFVRTDLDLYLVTAEHVAIKTSDNPIVVISDTLGYSKSIRLKDISKSKSVDWTFHPNSDVAVIQLEEGILEEFPSINPISLEIIALELEAPLLNRDLTMYGFPLGLQVGKRISPITETSRALSDIFDEEREDCKKIAPMFVISNPSIGG